MNTFFKRLFGILLLLAATVGLLFSLGGIYTVWHYRDMVAENALSTLDLSIAMMDSTSEGIQMARQSLQYAEESLSTAELMLTDTRSTLTSTAPILDTVQTLMDDDLPTTLRALQSSLVTAQKTAKIIDAVLRALTIFSTDPYKPETPFDQALGDMGESIADLPEAFEDISTSLENTSQQLELVESDLVLIEESLQDIQTSLAEFKALVQVYEDTVNQITPKLKAVRKQTPQAVSAAAVALTVFFAWMAIAQIGMFYQGLEMLNAPGEISHPPAEAPGENQETD